MAEPVEIRFWKYVPLTRDDTSCWLWTGYIGSWGYGRLMGKNKAVLTAHRLSYKIHKGEIPDGMVVRHTCDRPACVNPKHLILGTHAENQQDKAIRRRAITISDECVRAIYLASGTYRQISEIHNVSPAFVCHVKRGTKRKQAIGG